MPRLMVLSHGHPHYSAGGAEVAAHTIHRYISEGSLPGWESIFVARVAPDRVGHDGHFGALDGERREIVVNAPNVDGFFLKSLDRNALFRILDELVEYAQPDVVHAHHFTFWGLDIFDYFNAHGIPVVLTFHEYMAICHRSGQMLKTNGRLCDRSSPVYCNSCFPEISPGLFFLRERMFLEALLQADIILSPSNFLASRFSDWSNGQLNVTVVENPRIINAYDPVSRASQETDLVNNKRIGYFGQINQFKGIEVLLDAVALLCERDVECKLRLFGANLETQDERFRDRVVGRIEKLNNVEIAGPYRNSSVIRLMRGCGIVVIPSIWWENSPVVIQEAIQAGVFIVASRLGGIEEKLSGYDRAILFEPGSAVDLADKLVTTLQNPLAGSQDRNSNHKQDNLDSWRRVTDVYQKLVKKKVRKHDRDLELLSNSEASDDL